MFKVSVIIPCYNCQDYINRCLTALENQTFKDFEVVIVDDASTDNSLEALNEFAKNSALEIQILKNEHNCGPGVSRNKAVEACRGEYVCFCDCDDWYEPNYIEKMITALIENNADLAFCKSKQVYPSGKVSDSANRRFEGVIDERQALSLFIRSLCVVMVKREIMASLSQPNLRNGEDMATVPLIIVKAKKCVVINQALYNYYQRGDSASSQFSLASVQSLRNCFKHVKENMPSEYFAECEATGIEIIAYSCIVALFSCSKDKKLAGEIMNEFEKDFPAWQNNIYYKDFPRYKKVVANATKKRNFTLVKLLIKIKNFIKKK